MASNTLIHFDEVRKNNIKSVFLFVLFMLMIAAMGYVVGLFLGNVLLGIVITVVIGFIYSLISYFKGKAMINKLMGAKKATKKEYPHLVNSVEGLALAAGIPTPEVYVIETNATNAFATGRNIEDGAVTITTGLLNKLNREEVEGVIAHEIAHIKNYDIRSMMIATVMVGIIVILADIFLRTLIFGGGRGNNKGNIMFIVIGLILAILAPIIAQIIRMSISRKREYAADASAAVLTRNPRGLANALRKISGDNTEFKSASRAAEHLFISNPFKSKGLSRFFSTHPPTEERINRLERM